MCADKIGPKPLPIPNKDWPHCPTGYRYVKAVPYTCDGKPSDTPCPQVQTITNVDGGPLYWQAGGSSAECVEKEKKSETPEVTLQPPPQPQWQGTVTYTPIPTGPMVPPLPPKATTKKEINWTPCPSENKNDTFCFNAEFNAGYFQDRFFRNSAILSGAQIGGAIDLVWKSSPQGKWTHTFSLLGGYGSGNISSIWQDRFDQVSYTPGIETKVERELVIETGGCPAPGRMDPKNPNLCIVPYEESFLTGPVTVVSPGLPNSYLFSQPIDRGTFGVQYLLGRSLFETKRWRGKIALGPQLKGIVYVPRGIPEDPTEKIKADEEARKKMPINPDVHRTYSERVVLSSPDILTSTGGGVALNAVFEAGVSYGPLSLLARVEAGPMWTTPFGGGGNFYVGGNATLLLGRRGANTPKNQPAPSSLSPPPPPPAITQVPMPNRPTSPTTPSPAPSAPATTSIPTFTPPAPLAECPNVKGVDSANVNQRRIEVEVEGDRSVGTVYLYKQIHGERKRELETLAARSQLEILRSLTSSSMKHIFYESLPVEIPPGKIPESFQREIRTAFPNEIPEKLDQSQAIVLVYYGAAVVYATLNEGVSLHPTEDRQLFAHLKQTVSEFERLLAVDHPDKEAIRKIEKEMDALLEIREDIATDNVIKFLKRNPAIPVAIVYGGYHQLKDNFLKYQKPPQLISIDFPKMRDCLIAEIDSRIKARRQQRDRLTPRKSAYTPKLPPPRRSDPPVPPVRPPISSLPNSPRGIDLAQCQDLPQDIIEADLRAVSGQPFWTENLEAIHRQAYQELHREILRPYLFYRREARWLGINRAEGEGVQSNVIDVRNRWKQIRLSIAEKTIIFKTGGDAQKYLRGKLESLLNEEDRKKFASQIDRLVSAQVRQRSGLERPSAIPQPTWKWRDLSDDEIDAAFLPIRNQASKNLSAVAEEQMALNEPYTGPESLYRLSERYPKLAKRVFSSPSVVGCLPQGSIEAIHRGYQMWLDARDERKRIFGKIKKPLEDSAGFTPYGAAVQLADFLYGREGREEAADQERIDNLVGLKEDSSAQEELLNYDLQAATGLIIGTLVGRIKTKNQIFTSALQGGIQGLATAFMSPAASTDTVGVLAGGTLQGIGQGVTNGILSSLQGHPTRVFRPNPSEAGGRVKSPFAYVEVTRPNGTKQTVMCEVGKQNGNQLTIKAPDGSQGIINVAKVERVGVTAAQSGQTAQLQREAQRQMQDAANQFRQIFEQARAQPSTPTGIGKDFVGMAGSAKDTLYSFVMPGTKMEKITFQKRSPEDLKRMREEFGKTRRIEFLQGISKKWKESPEARKKYIKAGLTQADIDLIDKEKKIKNWDLHHKIALAGGGDNSDSNLVLIPSPNGIQQPFHSAITRYQREQTAGMKPGETKRIDFPIIPGEVYSPDLFISTS